MAEDNIIIFPKSHKGPDNNDLCKMIQNHGILVPIVLGRNTNGDFLFFAGNFITPEQAFAMLTLAAEHVRKQLR